MVSSFNLDSKDLQKGNQGFSFFFRKKLSWDAGSNRRHRGLSWDRVNLCSVCRKREFRSAEQPGNNIIKLFLLELIAS